MKETRLATCPICGAACGLIVEVEGNRIVSLRGDKDNPHSRGYICPKGQSLPEQQTDPDRLVEPRRKAAGGGWKGVGWDEALDAITERLAGVIERHGRDAVAVYAGDAATHHYANLFAVASLVLFLDTKNFFTANSLDSLPRQLASALLYGDSGMLPVPDVSRTEYLLIIGGNPVVSNGSIMTAPGFARHIGTLQKRGGRLVVVDPRRSETARLADEHYFIRPGTDALFLLAVVQTVFEENLDHADAHRIRGLRELRRIARDFSPESVATATGMTPNEIRNIAHGFSSAGSATCYGRMGVCAQEFGTTATWLTDALNIITGNLDRPGGTVFPSPAVDLAALMSLLGMKGQLGRWHTRAGRLPEFNGELPAVALASEIENRGRRQIRALITIGGNPALAVPNSNRLNAALEKLDFMVSLEPYLNATSRHADYILPPSIGLEHDSYPIISYATAIDNTAKYAAAAVAPPSGVRHDWETIRDMTLRLAARRARAAKSLEDVLIGIGGRFDPKGILRLLLDAGPYGIRAALEPARRRVTLRELESNPHGIDLGPHAPRLKALMGRRRIDIAPVVLKPDIVRLHRLQRERNSETGEGELILVSRRQLRFMNTCLHNIEKLAAGPEQCVLEIHPEDASARSVSDGGRVVISTKNGVIETEARITDDVMPGVVSLPFGWGGRQPGTALSVSERHHGANVNNITDETLVDAVSGMSAFNGTLVRVAPAAEGTE
jgi:anaerobic selenocysteine-containing dehydrogenase